MSQQNKDLAEVKQVMSKPKTNQSHKGTVKKLKGYL
jgi:hypothetical protein